MIGSILSALGMPALIKIVKGALSLSSNDKAVKAVEALEEVSHAISMNDISLEQLQEMNRHTEQMKELEKDISVASMKAVNETIQKEQSSLDVFIRRWRSLFGYAVALMWTLMMFVIIVVMTISPQSAPAVISSLIETTPLWMVALAVLGVSSFSPISGKGGITQKIFGKVK